MKIKVMTDTDDLEIKMKEMIAKCEEIMEMLDKTRDMVDASKEYFDTPAATYFRDKATTYIDSQKLVINNELIPSFEILNTISNAYKDDFDAEKKLFDSAEGIGDKDE